VSIHVYSEVAQIVVSFNVRVQWSSTNRN